MIQGEERERVEQYFLKSDQRREKLRYAAALNTYQSKHSRRGRWWTSTEVRIAASIILVVGLLLGLRQYFRQTPTNDGLMALQSAYRDQRPLEARIFSWNYAPAVSLRGAPRVDYVQRDRAASILQNAVNEHRDAGTLHQLGQFYLADRQFDKATDQLEAALALSPEDATIHSDLGAALLEKGKTLTDSDQGKAAELFAKSLAHLSKALTLDNSRLEALFNRALLYGYLGLPEKAEEDWRLYIEKDPNSNWTNEAKERLKAIEAERKKTSQTSNEIFDEFMNDWNSGDRDSAWKLIRDSQHRSGNTIVDRLLDDYVDRGSTYSQHASEAQPVAEVAAMYFERAEDQFYADVYESYRSASPQQIVAAKEARELMKAGHTVWPKALESQLRFSEAKDLFEKARDGPDVMLAEYWISFSLFTQTRLQDGLNVLEPLVTESLQKKYYWLAARCLYLRSSFEYGLNQHSKAIASAREGAKLAEKTGDAVGLLNLLSALVEYYRYVGNYSKSFAQFQRGLPILSSLSLDPIQSSRHYSFGAIAFAAVGFYDAAAEYQEQAMRISERAGIEDKVVYQHAFLGAINGKRGRFENALQNIEAAVQNASERAYLLAYSLLHKGHLYRAMGDCGKAVDNYSQSISLYSETKFPARLYEAHKGLLLCYIAQNDLPRAEQEIATILPLIEEYRKQISEENNRNSFFETEQSVYDTVIDFEVSRLNNPERAFQYLQESRGRSLLDLLKRDAEAVDNALDPEIISHSVAQPESEVAIKEQLPEGAQLVQYAVLEDKTLIWVISKREIALRQSNVSRRVLNETIQRYLAVISKPPNDRQGENVLAKQLYVSLIQPIESLLDSKRVICIVPDKNLSYIPFSALVSPASQKYLIEDYVVTTSQSPSVFLHCSKNATQRANVKGERLLSVGNPRFDRAAFPDLEDLPNAKNEAQEIAANYHDSLSLTESNATSAAVKKEMPRSDVVHLALHSVLDNDLPLNSTLLFAKNGSESSLRAYEIYRLRLDRTRLVVLSSCQTGAERYYDGEGMASLARAFIGAGVPMVIASLWPVDSSATEKLMVHFHQERLQNSSAQALANAQRAMLHGSETRFQSPYYWAAFTLNGGYAEF